MSKKEASKVIAKPVKKAATKKSTGAKTPVAKKIDLIVFDFDGTLSAQDSNAQFYKYCFKRSPIAWLYFPISFSIAFFGRTFDYSGVWWREVMRRFITKDKVEKHAANFIKIHRENRFGWASEQVQTELSRKNTKVILISAGPSYLVPKLVKDMNFDAVITSDMDKNKPWKYLFLCWGENKVVAMNRWAKANKVSFNLIRSYSDSKTDLPIMKLAKEQVWIDSKTGARIQPKF